MWKKLNVYQPWFANIEHIGLEFFPYRNCIKEPSALASIGQGRGGPPIQGDRREFEFVPLLIDQTQFLPLPDSLVDDPITLRKGSSKSYCMEESQGRRDACSPKQRCNSNHSVFVLKRDNGIIVLYADDIIVSSSDAIGIEEVKGYLEKTFHTRDLGPLHYFLGIEVSHSRGEIVLS
ncbi:hypothetical protein CK203_074022 [Vitis vinifera]|uniref:Reverse transcriptase Ty1/copia-type domain-containing protein n=1 Tax=Vitis vinifera TaxID=29760 RepID=A0A438E7X2_VITVI|nr:hypothetical protein CK203_074022 [Vitis vinifera]